MEMTTGSPPSTKVNTAWYIHPDVFLCARKIREFTRLGRLVWLLSDAPRAEVVAVFALRAADRPHCSSTHRLVFYTNVNNSHSEHLNIETTFVLSSKHALCAPHQTALAEEQPDIHTRAAKRIYSSATTANTQAFCVSMNTAIVIRTRE